MNYPSHPCKVRAKALQRASELAGQLAHEPQATLWAQEALHLARLTHDRWNLAWSLSTAAYFTERDNQQAVAMLEESLALFQELQDPVGLSHTLQATGRLRHGSAQVCVCNRSVRTSAGG